MSEFFEQLTKFSAKVFQKLSIPETQSPWIGGPFREDRPTGAIIHYTGGTDPYYTLRWFMREKYKANVSAHVVIADDWPEEMHELAEKYPLIHELPVMVVQCVPLDIMAWHATWANWACYGIEIVNAGEVRKDNGGWVYWKKDWTEAWQLEKKPVELYGKFWEPYTIGQISAVVTVLRHVRRATKLTRHLLVGHENVAENKSDPGPTFPMHGVREAVFGDSMLEDYAWYQKFFVNPSYGVAVREELAFEWADAENKLVGTGNNAWRMFITAVDDELLKSSTSFNYLGKAALRMLGYYTSSLHTGQLALDDKASITIFQRMAELTADGVPGPITRAAIQTRFSDRGFIIS